ncbi:MAG: hypothetical protein ACJ78I_10980 [Gemmatimonadaceae bacterium]
MPGTFRVESTFTITGRGFVIAGDVAAGNVRIGGWVAIPDGADATRLVRVTDVSMGRRANGVSDFVGLLLGELRPEEVTALRERLTTGLDLRVEDPEPGYEPPRVTRPSWAVPRPWWKFWSAT